jgi:hypothetical protein
MEIDCLQKNSTFKWQITLDRHNAIPRLNYYVLPDPSNFSLPSTFKGYISKNYFRCLKFNGLTIQRMMKEKFEKEGLSIIRDSFTYRNLCGKQVRSRGGGGG